MSEPIIIAENIGKRYLLDHQDAGGGYKRFSEVLVDSVKSLFRSAKIDSPNHHVEEFWALKDVSFEINRGDVVGIIGRNGAGKSTLLKILSRITEPTQGRITLNGRVASLLEVGTGFHPELTGRENIYLNGAILGMTKSEIKSKFDEIVAFAEIEKFLDTPVKRYSSGMYVRLAFAVAAHLEPEILIVDEVLAVGDAQFQAKCLGKMQDVAQGGRTVLFVSHNMGAVRSLCQKGIMLSQGKVVMEGDAGSVIDLYLQQPQSSGEFKAKTHSDSYITSCSLTYADGTPASTPFSNQELHLVIHYTNRQAIRGLRVGFSISTSDGAILTVCTPEDEGATTGTSEGNHKAIAIIDKNIFMKGIYLINAALWHGIEGTIYDDIRGIIRLQVEAARERAYAMEFQRAGIVQLPIHWEITK